MKQVFRTSLLRRRLSLTKEEISFFSSNIISFIKSLPLYQCAQTIGLYYPIKNEVNLLDLTHDSSKNFFFPVIKNNKMEFLNFNKDGFKNKDDMGVPIPVGSKAPTTLDILFVPCVGFNHHNARLGMGKGFYDLFIKNTAIKINKVILVAYSFQAVNFNEETHDLISDMVITERTNFNRTVVVLAAGKSERMEKSYKCLTKINDKFLYEYSLDSFDNSFQKIVLLPPEKYLLGATRTDAIYLAGSVSRKSTMINALPYISFPFTYIHDGARPYLSYALVNLLKENESTCDAFYLARKSSDTIRRNEVLLDRDEIIIAQTPQVFKTSLLIKAIPQTTDFPDDASLVQAATCVIATPIIHTSYNEKITYDAEMELFSSLHNKPLIGQSFDIHPLVENKPLILGGICIPGSKGLDGVSDGDCLLHSISEAIFGALGIGDLGTHFPPNNPDCQGLSSLEIINYAQKQLIKYNKYIINIDCLIYYEGVKLKPYYESIKTKLMSILQISRINIKATTTEKIGTIGQHEAIGCETVVLLGDK